MKKAHFTNEEKAFLFLETKVQERNRAKTSSYSDIRGGQRELTSSEGLSILRKYMRKKEGKTRTKRTKTKANPTKKKLTLLFFF